MVSRPRKSCQRCGNTYPPGGRCTTCQPPAPRFPDRRGSAASRGYGARHRNIFRRGVLARDPVCVLCKVRVATRADHYPKDRPELVRLGLDPDDPQYGRGLCAGCDSTQTAERQPGGWNRRNRGTMAAIVVVYGPPCAGKTTHVQQTKTDTDVVIDMDALAVALGSPRSHDHDRAHRQAAAEARDALITRYTSRPSWAGQLWVIQTKRPDPQHWPEQTSYHPLPTDRDTCHERARRVGRDRSVHDAIDRWWDDAKG